jgi:tRNA pseudouridine38-40 synthase
VTDPSAVPRLGVLLTVAYDGSRFAGFARQPTARTIAGELDGAVRAIDCHASIVRGASRTDAGVHALSQRVAFDTSMDIPSRGWVLALAQHTSDEVAIVSAARVPHGYDPRDHARKKTYRYSILCSPLRDPFLRGRTWRIGERLNQQLMKAEADELLGGHDFRAFRSSTDSRVDTVRTIFRAELTADSSDPRLLHVEIEGDRFLHRMVRIVVGALVDTGRGRLPPGSVRSALRSGNRNELGITAPPDGLCLMRLDLDDEGCNKWPDHLSSR